MKKQFSSTFVPVHLRGNQPGVSSPLTVIPTMQSTKAQKHLRVAFVGTYPPRECGIATFTQDLALAMEALPAVGDVAIAAIDAPNEHNGYGTSVRWRIEQGRPETYVAAGRAIAMSPEIDVVSIQHEFGLYGRWNHGLVEDHLPLLLQEIQGRKPVIITLHTVLPQPVPSVHAAMRVYNELADGMVAMVNLARFILSEDYGIAREQLHYIPHGVPQVFPLSSAARGQLRTQLGLDGRKVISTFGLIRNNKGLEYAIEAMPQIIEHHPDAVYLIVGETHPDLRRHSGESYRTHLVDLVRQLGLEDHVRFVNRYLSKPDLVNYLQVSDAYITPYLDRAQITSGTLAYALGCGRAVISTPYLYATEALAEHRGLLVEFANADSIARTINLVFDTPDLQHHLEREAHYYGALMAWPIVAQQYTALFAALKGDSVRNLSTYCIGRS